MAIGERRENAWRAHGRVPDSHGAGDPVTLAE